MDYSEGEKGEKGKKLAAGWSPANAESMDYSKGEKGKRGKSWRQAGVQRTQRAWTTAEPWAVDLLIDKGGAVVLEFKALGNV